MSREGVLIIECHVLRIPRHAVWCLPTHVPVWNRWTRPGILLISVCVVSTWRWLFLAFFWAGRNHSDRSIHSCLCRAALDTRLADAGAYCWSNLEAERTILVRGTYIPCSWKDLRTHHPIKNMTYINMWICRQWLSICCSLEVASVSWSSSDLTFQMAQVEGVTSDYKRCAALYVQIRHALEHAYTIYLYLWCLFYA